MASMSPQEQAEHRRGQRLLFLGLLFAVLLNYPLLAVFDHNGRVGAFRCSTSMCCWPGWYW
ncbi:hypothetical protein H9L05_18605 [Hymenobacter qilianensis]|uniref:Uncharacterized protein n=1 Tax=Hymenobacter qilianensis TaxID=1385715 RepID=A0A7H0H0Y8_9BACT|nr:hypothetical protein [Hymenobacter qilianensis]QNP54204.1 hypothetical protein H9L05_18605 [Hymenobacter qilianensis]